MDEDAANDEVRIRMLNVDSIRTPGINLPSFDNIWVRSSSVPAVNAIGGGESPITVDPYRRVLVVRGRRVRGKSWCGESNGGEKEGNREAFDCMPKYTHRAVPIRVRG